MVTFVCSNCNSSLKKGQVPIHGCNGTFACITCNSDFNKTTFKTHDRCITEAEKYQGSDFKPKVNKGEAKQETWSSTVYDALNNYKTIDYRLKSIISQVKNKANIPQKEPKFKNFLNSLPESKQIRDCHIIIWGIITAHRDAQKASLEVISKVLPLTNGSVAKVVIDTNDVDKSSEKQKKRKNEECNENGKQEPDTKKQKVSEITEEKTDVKQKKKSKQVLPDAESVVVEKVTTETNGCSDGDKSSEKKKKKNKKIGECAVKVEHAVVEEVSEKKVKKSKRVAVEEESAVMVEEEVKAEKKKKKKSKKDVEPMEVEEAAVEAPVVDEKKKKSKKEKKSKNNEEVAITVMETVVKVEKKKKKSKKNEKMETE